MQEPVIFSRSRLAEAYDFTKIFEKYFKRNGKPLPQKNHPFVIKAVFHFNRIVTKRRISLFPEHSGRTDDMDTIILYATFRYDMVEVENGLKDLFTLLKAYNLVFDTVFIEKMQIPGGNGLKLFTTFVVVVEYQLQQSCLGPNVFTRSHLSKGGHIAGISLA